MDLRFLSRLRDHQCGVPDLTRIIRVAVGVVRRANDVLIARRPDHVPQGGFWEFPGGKVEPGEQLNQALCRELHEELGIEVDPTGLFPFLCVTHDYGDKCVRLEVVEVTRFDGIPVGREGQRVRWASIPGLRPEDFPVANRPILAALRLPERWLISGPFQQIDEGVQRLRRALKRHRPGLVTLRAPWLPATEYAAYVREALAVCRAEGVSGLVHGDPARCLGSLSDAHGVHLPQSVARQWQGRGDWPGLLAVSCHDPGELRDAIERLGADLLTLSPVLPTQSHPETPALGWVSFAQWVQPLPVPVFALGGMENAQLETARRAGARGIAAIVAWW